MKANRRLDWTGRRGKVPVQSTKLDCTNRWSLRNPLFSVFRLVIRQFEGVAVKHNDDEHVFQPVAQCRSALDYSKPAWDSFESIPTEDADETLSSEWSKFFLKLFKLISYGITFALVLGSGVVAKLSLSLIASMTRVNKTVVNCNPNLPDILDHDKHYHSLLGLNSPERFAWLWVLFAVLITPDVFTFLRSLKSCLFKQYEMPDIWSILVVGSAYLSYQ